MAEKISNRKVFFNPFSKDNPVLVQILGICSVLAVTVKLAPALAMGLSVIAVLAFSNVIISILRKTIPTNIRIIVQLVVVAGLVVIVSQLLQAFIPRWRGQRHRLHHYSGERGFLPRTPRFGHAFRFPCGATGFIRCRICG